MKKLLLLLIALLAGVSGAWATDVTWESKSGWAQATGGKGAIKWFGAATPGTTDMEFTIKEDEFQIHQEVKANDSQDCYIAIAKSSSTTTLSTSEVVAVSNNHILPTASQLYTYYFDETVTLQGGTTYYIVFLTSNTPTDGAYPVGEGRVAVNHNTYGTYTPSTSYSNSWWPYYKATLTTDDTLTDYNYTCKNLAGYELASGVYSQASAPTAGQAPTISGYSYSSINVDGTDVTYTYSLATNPLSTLATAAADIASNPTYVVLASIVSRNETSTFYYYAESGGAVKGDYNQSTKEDAAHWILVGDETNGYKIYNARFGSAKVAVAAAFGDDQAISMQDAASNDGTLFDLRYISGAYRFYAKGTAYCTNRLSGSTKVIGIHSNVNAGSVTSIFRYYTNALYKQSDISTSKTYTIKSGARGYLFVNASGYVANNFSSTAESAAADANYQWAFVQAANGKYYLYNLGQGKFVGTLSSDGGRATVSNLSTTDYFYLTSTKSTSYYPLYLTGYNYNTSTYADGSAKYINTQGTSGTNNSVVYNSYSTLDGGNDFLITELNDFSSDNITAAKVALHNQAGGAFPAEFTAAAKAAVQAAPAQLYTIKGKLGTLEANSDGTYLTNTGKSSSSVAPSTDENQQWALFYVADNSYLLYNVGAEKYLSNDDSNNYALVADRASASAIQFRASTTGGSGSTAGLMLNYPVGIGVGSAWLNLNNGDSYTYGTTNYNHSEDVNNMFRIEPIDGKSLNISITYNLKWNGSTIDTQDASVAYGSAPSSPWDAPAYCDFSYDVENIALNTTEVNVTLNWNGPFTISSDFNTATWYYMKFAGKYASYAAAETYKTPLSASKTTNMESMWAFVGNPFDGVKVVNLSKGDGYYLEFSGYADLKTSGYINCTFEENGGNIYLNVGGGYYATRCSVADIEALGIVSSRTSNAIITVEAVDFATLALAFISDYAASHAVGQYYGVDQERIDYFTDYITENGCDGTYYKTLNTYASAYLTNKRVSTGYYRIKSARGRYLAYGQPSSYTPGLITVASGEKMTNASTVIKLVQNPSNINQFKILTEGMETRGMQTANTAFPVTSSGDDTYFTFAAASGNPGKATICHPGSNNDQNADVNGYLHEASWDVPGVVNWNATADYSMWEIEDATSVSIPLNYDGSAYSYGTMYLPFGVTITGAKAYYLTVEGNIAHAVEISEVPANTGVLLRADGNVSSVTATIKADASAEIEGNKLLGTNVGITSARAIGEYILGQNEGQIGFYQRGSGYNIGANKAYLKLDADLPAEVKGLRLDWDNATGIETVQGSGLKVNEVIYNLAGQRLSKVQSGVNVVNGKKLLVK